MRDFQKVRLNEIFLTTQGEGSNWGRSALFVRMPFCNLNCGWCDTEFNSWQEYEVDYLKDYFKNQKTRFAVLTGGEPTMNKQTEFIASLLQDEGYYVAIETNGSFPIPEGIDWVTCSPKRDNNPPYFINDKVLEKIDEIKLVVESDFNFDLCKEIEASANTETLLYLSPEYNDLDINVEKILDYIKDNPQWRLNLQTHKYIGVR